MDDVALKDIQNAIAAGMSEVKQQVAKSGEEAKSLAAEAKARADQTAKEHAEAFKAFENRFLDLEQKLTTQPTSKVEAKGWGQQFVESEQFKNFLNGTTGRAKVELKNTILGTVSNEPSNILVGRDRMAGIIPGAFRQLRIADLIPTAQTTSNAIEFAKELSFTNDAAETNEGAAKPESDLTFELATAPVRTIAHWLKVSKQLMEDAPAFAAYIERRMRYGVELRLENQIVNGNGTTPNLSGLLDSGNFTPFTPQAGENIFDAVNRAKYLVWSADYIPDTVVMNPADWGEAERTKSTGGGDGHYVAGIAYQYLQQGMLPTLWGLRVAVSNAVPAGTFIVFASDAVMLWVRSGVVVEAFEQDDDNVQKNLITIRAEMRAAFTVFRPAAVVAGNLLASGS